MEAFGKFIEVQHNIMNKGGYYQPLTQKIETEQLLSYVSFAFSKFKCTKIEIFCCETILPWLALRLPDQFHWFEIQLKPVRGFIPFQFYIHDADTDLFHDSNWDKKMLVEPIDIAVGCYIECWPNNVQEFIKGPKI